MKNEIPMKDKKLVVLVVEDSLLILERIFGMLEETDDIAFGVHAADYNEGIKMISSIRTDVVLLDINLPGKNGVDFLQSIKSSWPETKVIMLTNHSSEGYREICKDLGAEYFLDKSNDFDKIPELIRSFN